MAHCEMCGKEDKLYNTLVDGAELMLCSVCSKYGEIRKKTAPIKFNHKPVKVEKEYKIVNNFAKILKTERNLKGMTQEDFAKFLNVKHSIYQKWENDTLKPNIARARDLGKLLKKNFVEEDQKVDFNFKTNSTEKACLGDLVKIKVRKR
jgi:uncharacterized protein (TIGR00270 family)